MKPYFEKEAGKGSTNVMAGGSKDGSDSDQSSVSRRRALIVGLSAVPVVMSVMRQSAWGDGGNKPNCSIVASYVKGGNRFTSPKIHPGVKVTVTGHHSDKERCNL
jgi:hypothetical protein